MREKRLAMEALLQREQEDEGGLPLADDDVEVASTAVTGMSAYARTDTPTTAAASSSRAASTRGGRRPQRQTRKVSLPQLLYIDCMSHAWESSGFKCCCSEDG